MTAFILSLASGSRRSSARGPSLLAGLVLLALGAMAAPALALTCPDETGHSNANPVDVTYYLTATACTKTNPGASVLLIAVVKETATENSVTFFLHPMG